jgi:hypothetical protein
MLCCLGDDDRKSLYVFSAHSISVLNIFSLNGSIESMDAQPVDVGVCLYVDEQSQETALGKNRAAVL